MIEKFKIDEEDYFEILFSNLSLDEYIKEFYL